MMMMMMMMKMVVFMIMSINMFSCTLDRQVLPAPPYTAPCSSLSPWCSNYISGRHPLPRMLVFSPSCRLPLSTCKVDICCTHHNPPDSPDTPSQHNPQGQTERLSQLHH